jgi:hypothetical protein
MTMTMNYFRGGQDLQKHLYLQFRKQTERLNSKILSRKIELLADRLTKNSMKKILFYESLWLQYHDDRVPGWLQRDVELSVQQFEEDVERLEDGDFDEDFGDIIVNELQQQINDLTTNFWNKELSSWRGLGLDYHDDGFVQDDYDDYDERLHGAIRLA